MTQRITQSTHNRPLVWLLLLALFAQVLFPLQIHIHHATGAAAPAHEHAHEHIVDYHNKLIVDFEALAAFTDTVALDADLYPAAKAGDSLLKFAIFFILAIVSLFALPAHFRRRQSAAPEPLQSRFRPDSPPRAPPR